jgi:DNA anti-recombination protein RmuC
MHDVIAVGVPLLAILAGILFSRNDIKDLRAEMNARFNQIDGNVDARFNKVDDRFSKVEDRLSAIDADLRQFYHLTGKLEGRVDAIEKRF